MTCPYCGGRPVRVLDTIHRETYTRRRRECVVCGARFWTRAFDVAAANQRSSKPDRRLWIVSLRFSEQEMHMLRAAITEEQPTVTEVIRARVFVRPLSPRRPEAE